MTLAMILAFLAGHHFETACVGTQDSRNTDSSFGYAIDSIHFERGGKLSSNELFVSFTRTMYTSADCKSEGRTLDQQSGRLKILPKVDEFIASQAGEERLSANWEMHSAQVPGVEEGSIGINRKKSVLRIARNTPGFPRNTMLQLIPFQGTTR